MLFLGFFQKNDEKRHGSARLRGRLSNHNINPRAEVQKMVAHEYFDPHFGEPAAGSPPSTPAPPPPRKRFGGRLEAGIIALALVGGAGSGALTTSLLDRSQPVATTPSTGATTSTV